MLLVVDVGNTNITFGVYDGDRLLHTFRAGTAQGRTVDEHAVFLTQMLGLKAVPHGSVGAAIIASVVPPETERVAKAVEIVLGLQSIVIGPGTKTGVPVRYDNPRDVGADRIVDAVAAYARAKGGVIVIDFGTATTFNCVSPQGEYLGGVIAPGIQVSMEALMGKAAKLKPVEIAEPPNVVGKSTAHALQSGVVYGYAAMVEGLTARLLEELAFPCRVIATGGYSSLIARHAPCIHEVDENLTLEGLRLVYERNRA